jgi:hypothetical protein
MAWLQDPSQSVAGNTLGAAWTASAEPIAAMPALAPAVHMTTAEMMRRLSPESRN